MIKKNRGRGNETEEEFITGSENDDSKYSKKKKNVKIGSKNHMKVRKNKKGRNKILVNTTKK